MIWNNLVPLAMNDKQIPNGILVSGLVRSGTTWTARMLNFSPQTIFVLEPFNILRDPIHLLKAGTNYPYWSHPDAHIFQKIRSGVGLSFTPEEFRIFMKESSSFKYHLYHLVRYITLNRRIKKGMRPVVQDPFAIFMAPWLYEKLSLRPLFLFRHPAAYINSMKRMKWGFNFDWLARRESLMEGVLSPFKDEILKWAPKAFIPFSIETQCLVWNIFTGIMLTYRDTYPDWLFFRHEDLSMEPVAHFKKIYHELGFPFSAPIIKKIEEFTGTGNTVEAKSGKMHTLKRNNRANVKLWQKQLEPAEITLIRKQTEQVAARLYDDDSWPKL